MRAPSHSLEVVGSRPTNAGRARNAASASATPAPDIELNRAHSPSGNMMIATQVALTAWRTQRGKGGLPSNSVQPVPIVSPRPQRSIVFTPTQYPLPDRTTDTVTGARQA